MNVKIKKLGNGITNVIINDPKTYNSLSFKTLRDLLKTFIKLFKFSNDNELYVFGSLIVTIDIPSIKFLTFMFMKILF